jgi:signal transduction histidine kinase/predicted CoA-binding protein
MLDFLRKISLFSGLSEEDLQSLNGMLEELRLPSGAQLFEEGSAGERAYLIRKGNVEIRKNSGGRQVVIAVRGEGEMIGEMALLEDAPRMAGAWAVTDCVLLAISGRQLNRLLSASSSAARSMLHTVSSRLKATEAMLRQSEKMAQLGTMTAGMAHELNNPAAAALRGARQLHDAIAAYQEAFTGISRTGLSAGQEAKLEDLIREAKGRTAGPAEFEGPESGGPAGGEDPVGFGETLDRADREEALEKWFGENGMEEFSGHSADLADLGYGIGELEGMARVFGRERLPTVLSLLGSAYTVYSLLEEIAQGAGQISAIVKALKSYSYLDQGPVQEVSVREGIENTLIILRNKLKAGIVVRREYDDTLPRVQAYGSELNQVWTNLIDNAADAMGGKGVVTIRTRREGECVAVEVEDSGPGIPEAVQPQIFNPFFTTKPVGQGTGLGLNISYNIVRKHGGWMSFRSRPGKTVFEVKIPIDFSAARTLASPAPAADAAGEGSIDRLLRGARTIAVVGPSEREDLHAHGIPLYLKEKGYRIYPVHPTLAEFLGEKTYPDLASLPEKVDLALILRPAEEAAEIVEQAARAGIKAVWMEEGIVSEKASEIARDAGMEVVMDRCVRTEHLRMADAAKEFDDEKNAGKGK